MDVEHDPATPELNALKNPAVRDTRKSEKATHCAPDQPAVEPCAICGKPCRRARWYIPGQRGFAHSRRCLEGRT